MKSNSEVSLCFSCSVADPELGVLQFDTGQKLDEMLKNIDPSGGTTKRINFDPNCLRFEHPHIWHWQCAEYWWTTSGIVCLLPGIGVWRTSSRRIYPHVNSNRWTNDSESHPSCPYFLTVRWCWGTASFPGKARTSTKYCPKNREWSGKPETRDHCRRWYVFMPLRSNHNECFFLLITSSSGARGTIKCYSIRWWERWTKGWIAQFVYWTASCELGPRRFNCL